VSTTKYFIPFPPAHRPSRCHHTPPYICSSHHSQPCPIPSMPSRAPTPVRQRRSPWKPARSRREGESGFVGRGGLGAGCAFFSPNALIRGRQTVDVFSLFQVFRCRAFSLLRTKSSSLLTAIVSSLAPGSIFSHPVVQRRL